MVERDDMEGTDKQGINKKNQGQGANQNQGQRQQSENQGSRQTGGSSSRSE